MGFNKAFKFAVANAFKQAPIATSSEVTPERMYGTTTAKKRKISERGTIKNQGIYTTSTGLLGEAGGRVKTLIGE